MKNSRLSLQEIWQKGCREDQLDVDDQKRFASMARSRFHTFQMGISHAASDDDAEKSRLLISGLATELHQNPGLQKLWHRMEISHSESGEQVSLQVERLGQSVIH